MSLLKQTDAVVSAARAPWKPAAPIAIPSHASNGHAAPGNGLSLFSKVANYTSANQVRALGLYPYFRTISSAQDTEVIIDGQKVLIFTPRFDGRTYTVKSKPNSPTATWEPLANFSISDVGEIRSVTDLDATGTTKFYQVEITKP